MKSDDESNQELLEQLKQFDNRPEDDPKRPKTITTPKWLKKALSHIGLLVSLSIYCAGGGYVRLNILQKKISLLRT